MKKLLKILGIGFVAISILGAKKGINLLGIAKQLKYALQGLPKISISNKSIKINLKVSNPTNTLFNSSYFSIDTITLGLPNQDPFAISTKSINNITIEPNGYVIIKDVEFIINLTIVQIIQLATRLKQLELNFNVKFNGQPIKKVILKVADFI